MDPAAWRLFRTSDDVKNLLTIYRGTNSAFQIDPMVRGQGNDKARFIGTLGDFDIWVYNDAYTDDAGNTQSMLPAYTVLVGGNIGVPLSAHVEASTPDTIHVVEASSFQLEATDTFHPRVAAILNLSADHLDRHPDLASYAAAKARIFANQTTTDWRVVNADQPEAMALAAGGSARLLRYSSLTPLDPGVSVHDGVVWLRDGSTETPLAPLGCKTPTSTSPATWWPRPCPKWPRAKSKPRCSSANCSNAPSWFKQR